MDGHPRRPRLQMRRFIGVEWRRGHRSRRMEPRVGGRGVLWGDDTKRERHHIECCGPILSGGAALVMRAWRPKQGLDRTRRGRTVAGLSTEPATRPSAQPTPCARGTAGRRHHCRENPASSATARPDVAMCRRVREVVGRRKAHHDRSSQRA